MQLLLCCLPVITHSYSSGVHRCCENAQVCSISGCQILPPPNARKNLHKVIFNSRKRGLYDQVPIAIRHLERVSVAGGERLLWRFVFLRAAVSRNPPDVRALPRWRAWIAPRLQVAVRDDVLFLVLHTTTNDCICSRWRTQSESAKLPRWMRAGSAYC